MESFGYMEGELYMNDTIYELWVLQADSSGVGDVFEGVGGEG
jgi:hypothetical protein